MKKILAMVLAMMLVLSMSAAFAAEDDYTSMIGADVKFTKEYTIVDGESPAETFNFNLTYVGYKTYSTDTEWVTTVTGPELTTAGATFAALTATGTSDAEIKIDATKFPAVGIYKYDIKEVAGTTAGVDYDAEDLYLIVTILNNEGTTQTANNKVYVAVVRNADDDAKTDNVVNSYNAGTLAIQKEITGNLADITEEFEFTVTFTPDSGEVFAANQIVCSDADATVVKNADGTWTYTVMLGDTSRVAGDGDTVTFTNVPQRTTYTISEKAGEYTATTAGMTDKSAADGEITANEDDGIVYTNTLGTSVDTGIALDNAPYMILMALVVVAGAALIVKRASANR